MRNDVLPSFPSQLYIFGNNEVQMPNSDISLQMDSKVNVYGSSFCIDPKVFNDHSQLGDEAFALPSHSFAHYQPGPSSSVLMTTKRLNSPCSGVDYQTPMSSYNNIPQQSMLSSKKLTVPQQLEEGFQAMPNSRKRPIEVNDLLSEKGFNDSVGNKTTSLNLGERNKKKVVCSEKQWPHEVKESPIEIQLQVPVKRSQKLSDRITALQKLVSPYGKTDTASVLQEASIYIRLLQERIRNMFEMMSSSHASLRPLNPQKIEERQVDLRSRGLCLVPISITRKLTREERVDHHSMSRKTLTPRNFCAQLNSQNLT